MLDVRRLHKGANLEDVTIFDEYHRRFRQGDFVGALAEVDDLICECPDNEVLHYNRGEALHSLGRDDEAMAAFLHAQALSIANDPAEEIASQIENFVWPSRDDPHRYVFVWDTWWETLRRAETVLGEVCRAPGCSRPRLTLTVYCAWHQYESVREETVSLP